MVSIYVMGTEYRRLKVLGKIDRFVTLLDDVCEEKWLSLYSMPTELKCHSTITSQYDIKRELPDRVLEGVKQIPESEENATDSCYSRPKRV